MIAFVVGTTAELIKVAPVFHECELRGTTPAIWFTGQQVAEVPEMLERLGLPEPTRWLARGARGRNLERPVDVPRWALNVIQSYRRERRQMRAELNSDGKVPLVLVHGDTFTTVAGALLGRRLGVRTGHIEAGMRSGSLLSPLPEEANRRLVARIVDYHFAPSARQVANLASARGAVIPTGANTVVDSLKLVRGATSPAERGLPPQFGLATLHRFELMRNRSAFESILAVLKAASSNIPILFYAGAPERARIDRYGLAPMFDERLVLMPKLAYLDFLPVLGDASFVVTDSGGLQQECGYLGIPCMVHRERTESHEGLGENVLLSGMDVAKVQEFLSDPARYRASHDLDAYRPSAIICDSLAMTGHL